MVLYNNNILTTQYVPSRVMIFNNSSTQDIHAVLTIHYYTIITNAKAKAIHSNPNAYKIIYNLYKPLKIIKYICNITYYS